ncbi:META domain-containing protein [Pseudodesulfovibrio cashew]|uniref:META domain-containing protein n=1 Tax=Pseudodesulfovibrio cashew TaxID=2678688 RepID=A0A6I6J874_9BACT|nr:META domain-containing protein [Pseudodesulfovibrio cashew]QGY38755.1 META domain-containing protein [Pseudodesulfovibrio cashew]
MFVRRALDAAFLSCVLLTLLLAAGCGTGETPPVDPEVVRKELIGKVWHCESMFGRPILGDDKPTLEFLADGTVKGNGGCNDYSGTYALAAESLSFGPMTQTKKACGAALGDQEFTYITSLGKVNKLKVDGGELLLFGEQAIEPMKFTKSGGGLFW